MTTSDTSTATLLYPTTASELCINGSVGCGRKITWGPGLRACKGPLIRGRHGPTTARSPARCDTLKTSSRTRQGEVSTRRESERARGASRPQSKRSKSDCLIQNGCDPWTVGVAPGRQSPRSPSLICAQPAGPAHPPRPARATRQASLPTRPRWGHLLAAGHSGASCRGSPPPCPHRAIHACWGGALIRSPLTA